MHDDARPTNTSDCDVRSIICPLWGPLVTTSSEIGVLFRWSRLPSGLGAAVGSGPPWGVAMAGAVSTAAEGVAESRLRARRVSAIKSQSRMRMASLTRNNTVLCMVGILLGCTAASVVAP